MPWAGPQQDHLHRIGGHPRRVDQRRGHLDARLTQASTSPVRGRSKAVLRCNRAIPEAVFRSAISRLTAYKFLWSLSFAAPVQTFFLLDHGLSFAQIMLLESVLSAAIMLGEVPTGIVSDRRGRKFSLVCGAVLSLVAWVPFFCADSFALFAVSFAIAGLAFCFGSGSDQALIFDHLAADGRAGAMSRVFGRYGAAAIVAGGLAGLVGGVLAVGHGMRGYELVFGLTILFQLVALAVLCSVPDAPGNEEKPARKVGMLCQFAAGARLLRANADLRYVTLLSVFTPPLTVILAYGWQPYLQAADVPGALFGVAICAASAASMAANLLAHRLEARIGTRNALTASIVGPALVWTAMAACLHPALALVFYALAQGTAGLRGPIFAGATNPLIPSGLRATVLSTISVLCSLWMLVLRPALGALVDIDLSLGFAACGVSILAGWGLCVVLGRSRRVLAPAAAGRGERRRATYPARKLAQAAT
jgi:MFS transporter, DHA1 family, quinolone resistance protein